MSSLLPSILLVKRGEENFDPFHDFFPEKLKGLDQYWYFGEILKRVVYLLEYRDEESLLDRIIELRLLWNTQATWDDELNEAIRSLVREFPYIRDKYLNPDGSLKLNKLSESERVRYHLSHLDTDGFSKLFALITGREPSTYENLQLILALQRLKGSSRALSFLSSITGFGFNAFYRRYPTGRRVKIRRYYFGTPRYGDPGIYNGVWVYGDNVFYREEETDEYYVGPGWEEYFGLVGRPVIYSGEEVYTGDGTLVYGEVKFFPDPCEVWIVSDVTHLNVYEGSDALDKILDGAKSLLSPCSEVYLFPFIKNDERVLSSDSVEIEEVRYFVAVLREGTSTVVSPEDVRPDDIIVDPKVSEHSRLSEEVS